MPVGLEPCVQLMKARAGCESKPDESAQSVDECDGETTAMKGGRAERAGTGRDA